MFFAHVKFEAKWLKVFLVPLAGFTLGSMLDRTETNRMVMFRWLTHTLRGGGGGNITLVHTHTLKRGVGNVLIDIFMLTMAVFLLMYSSIGV